MSVPTKNVYEPKHDQVILNALKESPNNRNEAFRIAEKKLKEEFDFIANPNQISSRFYTFIKPKVLDKAEKDKGNLKNNVTASAGNPIQLVTSHSKQYSIVKSLVMRLSEEDQILLANEILFDIVGED